MLYTKTHTHSRRTKKHTHKWNRESLVANATTIDSHSRKCRSWIAVILLHSFNWYHWNFTVWELWWESYKVKERNDWVVPGKIENGLDSQTNPTILKLTESKVTTPTESQRSRKKNPNKLNKSKTILAFLLFFFFGLKKKIAVAAFSLSLCVCACVCFSHWGVVTTDPGRHPLHPGICAGFLFFFFFRNHSSSSCFHFPSSSGRFSWVYALRMLKPSGWRSGGRRHEKERRRNQMKWGKKEKSWKEWEKQICVDFFLYKRTWW